MKEVLTLLLVFIFSVGIVILNIFVEKKMFNPILLQTSYSVPKNCSVYVLDNGIITMTSRKGRNLLIFFHGQYGNTIFYDGLMKIRDISDTQVILVDYSGFGLSRKDVSIDSFINVHSTVGEWVNRTYGLESYECVTVWGESLGGNPAIKFSCAFNVDRLILASTFASLAKVINLHANTTFSMILKDDLNNELLIKNTKAEEVYIIHSTEDERISFEHAKILFQSSPAPTKLIGIKGGHSNPIYDEDTMRYVSKLICVDDVETMNSILVGMKRRYAELSSLF